MSQIQECEKCKLYLNQKPLLSPERTCQVFWVGLSAKKVVSGADMPLSPKTNSGMLIQEIEKKCEGINTYKTNLVKCLPLTEQQKLRYPSKNEIDCCFDNLLAEIHAMSPKIVFLLGERVYSSVGRHLNIKFEKWNGFHFYCKEFEGIYFVPIHHPSYIYVYRRKQTNEYIEAVAKMIKQLLQQTERRYQVMNSAYYDAIGTWADLLPESALDTALELREHAREKRSSGSVLFPSDENIFRALLLTPPERCKAVIVGQDPYFNPGQANGLCFSVNKGCRIPPSLQNIYKELHSDIPSIEIPHHGDLTKWAENGVLLLNSVLTVYNGVANSCSDWGWQKFTREVIAACGALPHPVVFLLWGRQAQGIGPTRFDKAQDKISLCSSHPSPLGASKKCGDKPAFLGSKPFSKTNSFLESKGAAPIDWEL